MNCIENRIEAALAERRRRAEETQDAQSGISILRQTMQHHTRLEGCELREPFTCNIGFRLDMAAQFSSPPGERSQTLLAGFAFRATIVSSKSPKLTEGSPITIFAFVERDADDIPAMLTILRCDQRSIPVPPADSKTPPSSNTSNSGEEQVKIMDSLYLLASKPVGGEGIQDGIPFLLSFEVFALDDENGACIVLETGQSSIRMQIPCEFSTEAKPDLYNFSRGIEEATTIYEVNAGERQLESPSPTPAHAMLRFDDAPVDAEENILITPRPRPSSKSRASAPQTRKERLEQREKRRKDAKIQHQATQESSFPDRIARNSASIETATRPPPAPAEGGGGEGGRGGGGGGDDNDRRGRGRGGGGDDNEKDCSIQWPSF